jgi:endonuclease-8
VDVEPLVASAYELLNANKGRWTQSTTGSLRSGETTYVYGRRGRSCRRCGTPIRVADQGERITYWCPTCQPRPG